jgi:hypothetical protein
MIIDYWRGYWSCQPRRRKAPSAIWSHSGRPPRARRVMEGPSGEPKGVKKCGVRRKEVGLMKHHPTERACHGGKARSFLRHLEVRRQYFLRSAVPLLSKAQGSPSMVNPLGGTTVQWTLVFSRLAPVLTPNARIPYAPLRAQSSPPSSTQLRRTGANYQDRSVFRFEHVDVQNAWRQT